MDFVFVPSGTFRQGTPGATDNERPYTATISRNYYVSRTEVTQEQWRALSGGANPSCFQTTTDTSCTFTNSNPTGPVTTMDWYAALGYANVLSIAHGLTPCYTLIGCADPTNGWQDGFHEGCTDATFSGLSCTGYRLPTESEWERAARAGTTTAYYWGEASDDATAGIYAWFAPYAGLRIQPVGGKLPNPYGLFDMSGNVWEWTWDWYSASYPVIATTDYIAPSSGPYRMLRGGSFEVGTPDLRSAFRNPRLPFQSGYQIGFRLARTAN